MSERGSELTYAWVRTGAVAGLVACGAYPALLLLPLPARVAALVIFLFGLALGVASVGLFHFFPAALRPVSLRVAVGCNLFAAFSVILMGFTQLSLHQAHGGESAAGEVVALVDRVQLGFDVVWDAFLAVGTFLLAWNMRRHPRLGRFLAWSGLALSLALLVLNFATFPVPPAEAGLVDVGPPLGIWYLLVTIQILRSLRWVRESRPGAG